jgi:hypothetical protein
MIIRCPSCHRFRNCHDWPYQCSCGCEIPRSEAVDASDELRSTRAGATSTGLRFISNRQRLRDIESLASQIPPDVTGVAGVPRSGLTPALLIAERLHLWPHLIHRDTGLQRLPVGWRMQHARPDNGTLLIVDDTIGSGRAMGEIADAIPRRRKTLKAAVYCNPLKRDLVDLCARELPLPHYLEWCIANSVYTQTLAFDLDGVICEQNYFDDDDPRYQTWLREAKPLHLPRQFATPLIVTYRCECHRSVTEDWLSRWGVRYDRLVMAPFDDWRRRDAELGQGEHKAKYLTESTCTGLVESHDCVAGRVHQLSKKLVICLETGKVYA